MKLGTPQREWKDGGVKLGLPRWERKEGSVKLVYRFKSDSGSPSSTNVEAAPLHVDDPPGSLTQVVGEQPDTGEIVPGVQALEEQSQYDYEAVEATRQCRLEGRSRM